MLLARVCCPTQPGVEHQKLKEACNGRITIRVPRKIQIKMDERPGLEVCGCAIAALDDLGVMVGSSRVTLGPCGDEGVVPNSGTVDIEGRNLSLLSVEATMDCGCAANDGDENAPVFRGCP